MLGAPADGVVDCGAEAPTRGARRWSADRCPGPHWRLVLEGAVRLTGADGTDGAEEVAPAGHAYYWPAEHTARMDEDTASLEIGPVAAMRQFSEHAKAELA